MRTDVPRRHSCIRRRFPVLVKKSAADCTDRRDTLGDGNEVQTKSARAEGSQKHAEMIPEAIGRVLRSHPGNRPSTGISYC